MGSFGLVGGCIDPAGPEAAAEQSKVYPAAHGSFGWGGAAATHFLLDPADELCVVICTQVLGYMNSFARPYMNECVHKVYALFPDA